MGSSPLTRGKLRERVFHVVKPGLIPAHAGKTSHMASKHPSTWAHPRSRGENLLNAPPRPDSIGSSPLTRGKPSGGAVLHGGAGLIPAHAGKTSNASRA